MLGFKLDHVSNMGPRMDISVSWKVEKKQYRKGVLMRLQEMINILDAELFHRNYSSFETWIIFPNLTRTHQLRDIRHCICSYLLDIICDRSVIHMIEDAYLISLSIMMSHFVFVMCRGGDSDSNFHNVPSHTMTRKLNIFQRNPYVHQTNQRI